MPAIREEWTDPARTPIDFIVVGAGAGGAPLAARLVERGYVVLVVEMGPEKPARPAGASVENTEVPLLHAETTEDARHSLRFFVKHFDDDPDGSRDPKVHKPDNARRDERGIFYPRAQGVGGCTVHNAMITICGLSEDWDEIAEATGDESWRGERMRPYFQRVETCHYASPTWLDRVRRWFGIATGWEGGRHGDRGWLSTTLADLRLLTRDRRLLRVVLDAAFGALRQGVDRVGEFVRSYFRGRALPGLDPNHWETMRQSAEGLSRIPCAITPTGERSSPRERLLALAAPESAHRSRLHILSGAFVTEVVLEEGPDEVEVGGVRSRWRAVGVRCLPREHVYEADPAATVDDSGTWKDHVVTLRCHREVLLCGGAFNTPQLLMLSGIGPPEQLGAHDVPLRVPLGGVGQGLQDRYEVPVVATVTDRFRTLDGLTSSSTQPDPELARWEANRGQSAYRRGLYSTNGGLVGIFVRSSQEDAAPDLFIFALAGYFPGYHVGYSRPAALNRQVPGDPPDFRRTLTWLVLKARTRQHQGEVRLQSNNPFRRPEINFRSFPESNDKDLEALYEGVRFVQAFLALGEKKGTIQSQELPGFGPFAGDLRKYLEHTAWGHHACGTCKIGGANAVLDSRFRVRGVRGLRVVDASIFPRIPGFFIVANIYMAAEKAADVITEDHPRPLAALPAEVREALRQAPVLPSSPAFEARRLYPAELEAAEARQVAARRRAAGL